MHWHAEVVDPASPHLLTLRGYDVPDGFERRLPYRVVGQVMLDKAGGAFLFAFLARSSAKVSRREWLSLATFLEREHGVVRLSASRRHRDAKFPL